MYTPFEHTAEGFEMQFGTNHVGHFLLTCLLVPQLLADPPSRVVNLSSGGHMGSDIVWDDPNFERRDYDKFAAVRAVEDRQHPVLGGARPPPRRPRRARVRGAPGHDRDRARPLHDQGRLQRARWNAPRRAPSGGMPPRKTVEQGAATSVWAATAPELDDQGGTYLADAEVTDEHAPWARDPESAARLWTLSEELVGQRFDF